MTVQFLSCPNIPDCKARLCAIGEGNPEIKAALENMGISVLEVPAHPALDPRVARHADMQLHDMGKGRVAAAKDAGRLIRDLEQLGFIVEQQELTGTYPGDIALNCFALGKYLYCKEKSTSEILLNYYQSMGVEAVNINQGYAKCSVCIVDNNSIITADKSIAAAVKARGADVLIIQSSGILLDGFDTGFIGGCCGLLAPDKLAFSGMISRHSDYIQIRSFCAARGVEPVELTNLPLKDIGGIIPLTV